MTAMARATSHVGLVSTVSTTFSEPFLAARMLASLDHISGGRVGWNVVTSMFDAEARNHGMEALPGHGQRYERAAEFIEVALRLWDSWDDEALVQEPDGMYADPALVRPIDHAGEHFRVSGPLTVPRSSQGRPVLFHAGASGPGRELAARYAEGIYAVAYDLSAAQSDYADLKKRIGSAGRDPASVAVMPGLATYVGSTEAEAVAKQSRADALLPAKQPLAQLAPSSGRTAPVGNWTPRSPNCPARAVQRSTGPLRDDPADRGGRGAHGAAAAGPSRGRRRALHHGRHPRAHRRPDRGVVPLRCR
ncbi:NtaA/DmoA family FMN-dependent monooxygenase [Citricoccus sp. NPDC079358]|uniref:NtaA/DmoA family FMN-dependent monooxygenase n=1 Tax=Citricoccus sp. NPDC079358 TaxID=3154653 RepID=UPI00344C9A6C